MSSSTTSSSTTQVTDAGVPPAAASAGYTNLVFNGTFETLDLSPTGTGAGYTWYDPGVWYQDAGAASTPTNDGGVLELPWKPGQFEPTVIGTMAANGENDTSWLHFYIEVSMAFDAVTASWPTLWMLTDPATTSYEPPPAKTGTIGFAEIDIFAWQSETPNTFYGTIKDWSGTSTYTSDVQDNTGANEASFPGGADLGSFNTYGVLWTPTEIDWYFNDQRMLTATSADYSEAFSTLNASPMYLMLENAAGEDWGAADASPSGETVMKVQWVRVWQ